MLVALAFLLVLVSFASPASAQRPATHASSGRDSPSNAPVKQAQSRQVAGSQLSFDPAARRAQVRVDSGDGLDQYTSGVISFGVDMQGFDAGTGSGRQASVKMFVFDVDEQGSPPDCAPEVDQVSLNGTPIGLLSGSNDGFSVNTFGVSPGLLNKAVNVFQIVVDTAGSGCWKVLVDWVQIEFDFNIAHTAVDVTADVPIRRGKSNEVIPDRVFQTDFESDGRVKKPSVDEPIADSATESRFMGSGFLKYKYTLGAWPKKPDWTPKVEAKWSFELDGRVLFKGSKTGLSGWEGTILVGVPLQTGKMRFRMELVISKDGPPLQTESRVHPIYMVYAKPVASHTGVPTEIPKTYWLDKAFEWGAGNKSAPHDILSALAGGIYDRHPASWVYYGSGPLDPPLSLLEETGKNGQCTTFEEVWSILAASMGIAVGYRQYEPDSPFITKTRAALDKNVNANVISPGMTAPERWLFRMHQWGTFAGRRYDPTFGLLGADTNDSYEAQAIFCKFEPGKPCAQIDNPNLRYRAVLTGRRTSGNWPIMLMQTVTLAGLAAVKALAPQPVPQPRTIGGVSDRGDDPDGNGQFEYLRVELPIDLPEGMYSVETELSGSDGSVLAKGTLDPASPASDVTQARLGPGAAPVVAYFRGLGIRDAAVNGPYNVDVRVVAADGTVADSIRHATKAYSHTAFQGVLAAIGTVTDSVVDAKTVRVNVPLPRSGPGAVRLRAELMAGDALLGSIEREVTSELEVLDFPADALWTAGVDGPYTVSIAVSDRYTQSARQHQTAAYRVADFQRPAGYVDSAVTDQGRDADGDGLFDTLEVSAGAGGSPYTLEGTVTTLDGNRIVSATTAINGTSSVVLSFDGKEISRAGKDGPFLVKLTVVDGSGNAVMERTHRSAAYAASKFARPDGLLTATYTDAAFDGNGDGHPDVLRVNASVAIAKEGAYTLGAALFDRDGGFITMASVTAELTVGAQTMTFDFPGEDIRRHGVDGPYTVTNVTLRLADADVDFELNAHQTAAYRAALFRPGGGLFVERVVDRVTDPDGDGKFDQLEVDLTVIVSRAGKYTANARLVDATGEEIAWTDVQAPLALGEQVLRLAYAGSAIYGHGVDGPFRIADLTIAAVEEAQTPEPPLVISEAHQTAAYPWAQFEAAGLVIGRVSAGGQPVPGAVVAVLGIDYDLTDAAGEYRLGVPADGEQPIAISAAPGLAPWRIYVNGVLVGAGTQATIPVTVGATTVVDFVSASGSLPGTGSRFSGLIPAGVVLVLGGAGFVVLPGALRLFKSRRSQARPGGRLTSWVNRFGARTR